MRADTHTQPSCVGRQKNGLGEALQLVGVRAWVTPLLHANQHAKQNRFRANQTHTNTPNKCLALQAIDAHQIEEGHACPTLLVTSRATLWRLEEPVQTLRVELQQLERRQ